MIQRWFLRLIIGFGLFLVGGILVWTGYSLYQVRILAARPKTLAPNTVLSEEVAFEVGSQSTRISYETDSYIYRAVMTWVKGSPLFFTNEHVLKGACDKEDLCTLSEADAFDRHSKERQFQKKICLPLQDLCVLLRVGETAIPENFHFAPVSVGQEVFYVDAKNEDFRIFRGHVEQVREGGLSIQGYARHGFSGSPVFDSEGRIVGVMSHLTSKLWEHIPHYLIFGWSQDDHFNATRWPDLKWTLLSQDELNTEEWQRQLKDFSDRYASRPEVCSSFLPSFKLMVEYFVLIYRWEPYIGKKATEQVERMLEGDPTTEDICRKIIKSVP